MSELTLILTQTWEEDLDEKTGWFSCGWFYENGKPYDGIGYVINEVLDTDKHGNITKALFKLQY